MQLSTKQVHKFQELYRQKFGEKLSYEVAHEKAIKLVRLIEIISKHKTSKRETGKE
jgi:hypothetical protein